MKKTVLLLLFAALTVVAQAQTRDEMGGVYCAYQYDGQAHMTAVPDGYQPFYISHYGRHGSRWMPSDARYEWMTQQLADSKNLTPLGKKVQKVVGKICRSEKGKGGLLTTLGAQQHRDIARRMVDRVPEMFKQHVHIQARSSYVNRCVRSMEAFTSQLLAMDKHVSLEAKMDSADMAWMAYTSPEEKELENTTVVVARTSPDRLMDVLFKDPAKVENAVKLMSELHALTSSIQDTKLDIKGFREEDEALLHSLFTDDEYRAIYEQNNRRMTICNGIYATNNEIPARCALSLWQNCLTEAAKALGTTADGKTYAHAVSSPSIFLRFGHDTHLYRLLSLLQLGTATYKGEDGMDRMYQVIPMAANLQMIFYRKNGETVKAGDTVPHDAFLVKFLLNEKEVTFDNTLPTVNGVYYRWTDVLDYMARRIHDLGHLTQLNALNTMVGTAQANTKTAGLFGKGSEEHGQTLPAVLVPNGQNFWTPQTQDTEKKCIAPYYYKDTLLQGFRNSHWIVGGCTQDYGSFTVAAITGNLRLQPEERATGYSHKDEVSHPHYYAVRLKDERLKAELTAASHAAILRVTPDKDGTVHIVLNPNSDEGQGYIEVDTVRRLVYGYNPVHRIYQGWGEPAGFSGHFVLRYTGRIADFGTFDSKERHPGQPAAQGKERIGAWLSFQGQAHEPMEFVMSSSFTSKENALANMEAEAKGGFNAMMQHTANAWTDRLHTIDIEDRDTAKVNQFYGALYRASFLPREMSDCNGDYPRFATGTAQKGKTAAADSAPVTFTPAKVYGDFSMWDIYRAELPLYNIITPAMSADMMQSLVKMYTEGSWLPIFPCWNSFTAAMIGDHASAALADAYVKGIRGFDIGTAYTAMRKNAFETPRSFEDYKNGMGRRALTSYLRYNYIPMEDSVKEAFHTNEQTSRTLEYAFDDFALAQVALALGKTSDYNALMKRSENWRNVINPKTGWADGRHRNGKWENNLDLVNRKSYITEGAVCHYTWYVPQNPQGLFSVIGKATGAKTEQAVKDSVIRRLDRMFDEGLYWHGNEPCHQVAYLYDALGAPEKTRQRVKYIMETEYNDSPGGLSGNDDAGQMSAWYVFSALGFYPVCPATPYYYIGAPSFDKVTIHQENGHDFILVKSSASLTMDNKAAESIVLKDGYLLPHEDIVQGGTLHF